VTVTVSAPASTPTFAAGSFAQNYTAIDPTRVESLNMSCPPSFITSYTNQTARFKTTCGYGLWGNDLSGVIAYDFVSCIEACVAYNKFSGQNGGKRCQAVTMASTLKKNALEQHGNCWLKYQAVGSNVDGWDAYGASLCGEGGTFC
jgi:hypothetical protein